MGYGQPSAGSGGGDQFKVADYVGRLVLLENVEPELQRVMTRTGQEAEVARADVTVLPEAGMPVEVFSSTFIFGRALAPTLARAATKGDTTLLGRVAQGVAKNSQNPPWVLQDHTPADAAIADAYVAQRAAGRFASAQPSAAAAPAPQPYQPAAAPAPQPYQPAAAPAPQQFQPAPQQFQPAPQQFQTSPQAAPQAAPVPTMQQQMAPQAPTPQIDLSQVDPQQLNALLAQLGSKPAF